jgi:hypothetical protein
VWPDRLLGARKFEPSAQKSGRNGRRTFRRFERILFAAKLVLAFAEENPGHRIFRFEEGDLLQVGQCGSEMILHRLHIAEKKIGEAEVALQRHRLLELGLAPGNFRDTIKSAP